MSTISITQSQLRQVQQVLDDNPNDPAAVWAALSHGMKVVPSAA